MNIKERVTTLADTLQDVTQIEEIAIVERCLLHAHSKPSTSTLYGIFNEGKHLGICIEGLSFIYREAMRQLKTLEKQESLDTHTHHNLARVLLCVEPSFQKGWRICQQYTKAKLEDEWSQEGLVSYFNECRKFNAFCVRISPKAGNAWEYRRWLVETFFKLVKYVNLLSEEESFCFEESCRYHHNYYSWVYWNWISEFMGETRTRKLQYIKRLIGFTPGHFAPWHHRIKIYRADVEDKDVLSTLTISSEALKDSEVAIKLYSLESPWLYREELLRLTLEIFCSKLEPDTDRDMVYDCMERLRSLLRNELTYTVKEDKHSNKFKEKMRGHVEDFLTKLIEKLGTLIEEIHIKEIRKIFND